MSYVKMEFPIHWPKRNIFLRVWDAIRNRQPNLGSTSVHYEGFRIHAHHVDLIHVSKGEDIWLDQYQDLLKCYESLQGEMRELEEELMKARGKES